MFERKSKQPGCAGCGARSATHPWVGVMREGDAFVSVPVCEDCWRDPGHRKVKLKAHFFPAKDAAFAVSRAWATSLGG